MRNFTTGLTLKLTQGCQNGLNQYSMRKRDFVHGKFKSRPYFALHQSELDGLYLEVGGSSSTDSTRSCNQLQFIEECMRTSNVDLPAF